MLTSWSRSVVLYSTKIPDTFICTLTEARSAKKQSKTYNSGYSPVVTHLTTNPPVHCLSTAERTGSSIFSVLWSYVEVIVHSIYHINATLLSFLIIRVSTRTSRFPSNHPNFLMGAKNKSRRRSRTYSGYSPLVTHLTGDVG
jgi:hypothetical protein